jgi:hypothetical protein
MNKTHSILTLSKDTFILILQWISRDNTSDDSIINFCETFPSFLKYSLETRFDRNTWFPELRNLASDQTNKNILTAARQGDISFSKLMAMMKNNGFFSESLTSQQVAKIISLTIREKSGQFVKLSGMYTVSPPNVNNNDKNFELFDRFQNLMVDLINYPIFFQKRMNNLYERGWLTREFLNEITILISGIDSWDKQPNCKYIFTKGARAGSRCGLRCLPGANLCKACAKKRSDTPLGPRELIISKIDDYISTHKQSKFLSNIFVYNDIGFQVIGDSNSTMCHPALYKADDPISDMKFLFNRKGWQVRSVEVISPM